MRETTDILNASNVVVHPGGTLDLNNTTQSIGLAMGGVIGGWLLKVDGPSAVFFACSALVLAWLIVASWMKPPPRKTERVA